MSGMKERIARLDLCRVLPLITFACCFLCSTVALAQASPSQPPPAQIRSQRLEEYLRNALREETGTRYVAAFFDLDDDERQEAIVYFMDPFHCGTGGCETWVLAPKNSSFRVVSKISIVQLPIRALATKSHGWHDLGVGVRGGGIQQGYEARLSFNGKKYPHNPTVPPAKRITGAVAIKTLIPESAKAEPLFP
jgi:hypothetical protein